jgi:putative membrane protein
MDGFRFKHLNEILDRLYDIQGKCERIKNTPLPRQYAFFTTLFTRIFVVLLPFGFVAELGWYTIPLSVLISWIFNTLEQVGTYTENPFDNGINDIPMSALCVTIERDLKSLLGEDEIPEPIKPTRGILM